MNFNTFLFDFDGTILDSKAAIVHVFFQLTQKYGTKSFTFQEIDSQFGSSFKAVSAALDPVMKEDIERDYFEMMFVEEQKHAKLFPFIRDSLYEIKSQGHKLGLITNKEKLIVFESLNRFQLCQLFDSIVTFNDVTKPKPDAEPIEKTLKILNASKEESLMIGDSVYDIGAARNAGVKCAVIDWYYRYPLEEMPPDYFFTNIKELMNEFKPYREVI